MNQHASLNRFYRLVWSVATQTWHVVSEITKGQGKGSGRSQRGAVAATLAALALMAPGSGAQAQQAPPALTQLPTGGSVSAGAATISSQANANASIMTVQQSTSRAVINWNTFNVGQSAKVQFNQPSATSVTLNKIADQNPSQIFGQIQANGQVVLSNPSGIFFSPSARVDVGGLVATTHTARDSDFMAGNLNLLRAGASGAVVNEGSLLSSLAGYVALLAPEVRNSGVVLVRAGTVAMASGEMISLQFEGGQSLMGIVTTPSAVASLIENRHAVTAPDGQIILSAVALNQLQAGVIRNAGVLEASSLTSRGGKIVLEADQIELKSGSSLLANGPTGGGTVLVGGDWQGTGAMRQATSVLMEKDASIHANALTMGNGGKVVLWSNLNSPDGVTQATGRIEAKGGTQSGDGGQVETSGHRLKVNGVQVSTAAPAGNAGQWLLDPTDLIIAPTGGDVTGADITTALLSNSEVYVRSDNSLNSYVSTRIGGGASGTNGDIQINDNISISTASKLYFVASGVIYGSGNITVSGAFTSYPMKFGLSFNQGGDSRVRGVSYSGSISGGGTVTQNGYTNPANFTIAINEFWDENAQNLIYNNNPTTPAGLFVISGQNTLNSSSFDILKGTLALSGSASFTNAPSIMLRDTGNGGFPAINAPSLDISAKSSNLTIRGITTQDSSASKIILGSNSLTIGESTLLTMNYSGGSSTVGYNTFPGVISGTGGLTILNPYPQWNSSTPYGLALGGVNTYTGTTTIGQGATLLLKDSGSIATSSNVVVTGKLDIGGVTSSSVSTSSISGNGTIYTNSPARSGTLWGSSYSFAAGASKELKVTNASETFAGDITGTGSLKVSGGSLTLTGTNTYTGITTIDAGATLQLGSGGTTGAIASASDLTLNGTLAINLSTSPTLSNNISGTGLVNQMGTGTTLLTGTVTNSGANVVSAGRLCIGQCPFDITTLTTSAQIQALTNSEITGLSNSDIALMTATQLGFFTNAQLALLSNAQLALLTTTHMGGLTSTQIPSMSLSQLGALSASQLAAMSATQLASLASAQVTALTTSQMASLNGAQVAALNSAALSAAQLSALSVPQLSALSADQVGALSSTQMGALSATQLASLSTAQVVGLTTAQIVGLTSTQLAALTATQMAQLSGTQVGAFSATQVAALTSTQLGSLTATQMASLNSAALSATQVGALTVTQLGGLTASQVAALSSTQVAVLTSSQIAALSAAQVGGLTATQLASLSTTQFAALTATQLGLLSPTQVGGLTVAQVAALSATQLSVLTATQMAALSAAQLSSLSVTQLGELSASQVAALTSTQLGSLVVAQVSALTVTQLGGLSAAQVASLNVAALNATQVGALSVSQLGGLTATQVGALSGTQLAALTTSQLASLSTSQLGGLSATQIALLSGTQIAAFTGSQLSSLSSTQIAGLTADQRAALSPTQISLLPGNSSGTGSSGGSSSSGSSSSTGTTSGSSGAGSTSGSGSPGNSSSSGGTSSTGSSSGTGTTTGSSEAGAGAGTSSGTGNSNSSSSQAALVASSQNAQASVLAVLPSASVRPVMNALSATVLPVSMAMPTLSLEVVSAPSSLSTTASNSAPVASPAPATSSSSVATDTVGVSIAVANSSNSTPSEPEANANSANKSVVTPSQSASRETSSASSVLPVVSASIVSTSPTTGALLDVRLPSQVVGTSATSVLVQLPSQVTSAIGSGTAGVKVMAADNGPAPAWVQYSEQRGGLVVGSVPAGSLPAQIKLVVGGQQFTVQLDAPRN